MIDYSLQVFFWIMLAFIGVILFFIWEYRRDTKEMRDQERLSKAVNTIIEKAEAEDEGKWK